MFSEKRKEDIEKFVSAIMHDDHDSNYFICYYADGSMHSYRTSRAEFSLEQVKEKDCYFSLNGFAGYHRKSDECRQINGIVVDLDYHEASTKAFRRWIVGRNLAVILDAVDAGDIPAPNIITNTGRGIQLLYLFEKSISYFTKSGEINEKAIFAYKRIQEEIMRKVNAVLPEEDSLEIDRNVNDISRVVRILGTKNSKSDTVASIVYTNDEYYSFSDFYKKKDTSDKKKSYKKSSVKGSCGNKELQQARINELEKLVELRGGNCEGYRNYMALLYYNAAVQIFEKDKANKMLFEFCKKFNPGTTPFTKSQINASSEVLIPTKQPAIPVITYSPNNGLSNILPLRKTRRMLSGFLPVSISVKERNRKTDKTSRNAILKLSKCTKAELFILTLPRLSVYPYELYKL